MSFLECPSFDGTIRYASKMVLFGPKTQNFKWVTYTHIIWVPLKCYYIVCSKASAYVYLKIFAHYMFTWESQIIWCIFCSLSCQLCYLNLLIFRMSILLRIYWFMNIDVNKRQTVSPSNYGTWPFTMKSYSHKSIYVCCFWSVHIRFIQEAISLILC